MSDDPDAWPDPWPEPWVYEDWLQEKLRRDKDWQKKQRAQAERQYMEQIRSKSLSPCPPPRNPAVREARVEEFKDNLKLRKWAIWRQYRAGGTSLRKVGEDFGIGPERIRQLVYKCERLLRMDLNRAMPGIPAKEEVREGTRGVEFVFRNELAVFDREGWEQLEFDAVGSAYSKPISEWPEEWGKQDPSPAREKPSYTLYRVIAPKEQTND